MDMKTMPWITGVLMSVVLLTACSSVAHVQKDNNVDISRYKTYAWVAGTQKDSLTEKSRVTDLTDQKIRESIDRNLQLNGWTLSKSQPDVLLVFDVDIQRETRLVSDPVYSYPATRWFYSPYTRRYVPVYYPSQFIGYDRRRETYREGTLTITVMDAKTEKTIWQGWTISEVDGRRLSDHQIEDNVKAILKKLK